MICNANAQHTRYLLWKWMLCAHLLLASTALAQKIHPLRISVMYVNTVDTLDAESSLARLGKQLGQEGVTLMFVYGPCCGGLTDPISDTIRLPREHAPFNAEYGGYSGYGDYWRSRPQTDECDTSTPPDPRLFGVFILDSTRIDFFRYTDPKEIKLPSATARHYKPHSLRLGKDTLNIIVVIGLADSSMPNATVWSDDVIREIDRYASQLPHTTIIILGGYGFGYQPPTRIDPSSAVSLLSPRFVYAPYVDPRSRKYQDSDRRFSNDGVILMDSASYNTKYRPGNYRDGVCRDSSEQHRDLCPPPLLRMEVDMPGWYDQ